MNIKEMTHLQLKEYAKEKGIRGENTSGENQQIEREIASEQKRIANQKII